MSCSRLSLNEERVGLDISLAELEMEKSHNKQ